MEFSLYSQYDQSFTHSSSFEFHCIFDLRFSWWSLWRVLSSGMWGHAIWYMFADISQELTAFIFRLSENVTVWEKLLIFVVNSMGFYYSTSQIHGFNIRNNFDLYCPQTNLSVCLRGPYYFSIKFFNHLPLNIKELSYNAKQFRIALRAFLYSTSFYTLEEYFNQG
jgi:hypothetical protein